MGYVSCSIYGRLSAIKVNIQKQVVLAAFLWTFVVPTVEDESGEVLGIWVAVYANTKIYFLDTEEDKQKKSEIGVKRTILTQKLLALFQK